MNVLDLANGKTTMKKAANTHGGEYHGPCPACWGKDRFHVWPMENDGNGAYWCRQCGKNGDNIQFLIDFNGKTFPEACKLLGREDKLDAGPGQFKTPRPKYQTPISQAAKESAAPCWVPEVSKHPDGVDVDAWQEKAGLFMEWAFEQLMKLRPYPQWLKERGIDEFSAKFHRIGWNPGQSGKDMFRPRSTWGLPPEKKDDGKNKQLWIPVGLVIPHRVDGKVARIRIRTQSKRPPYYVLPGSAMGCMVCQPTQRAFVIVESELDAVMLDRTITDMAGIVALGNSSRRPDTHTHAMLQGAARILVVLDSDEAGAKATKWWVKTYPQALEWPVLEGKDAGEAYTAGYRRGRNIEAMNSLRKWTRAGLPTAWFT